MPIRRAFASLAVAGLRWFFIGQLVSIAGTTMTLAASLWVVQQRGGGPVEVGLTRAMFDLPLLVLAPRAGRLADRVSPRSLVAVTEVGRTAPALALAALFAGGTGTLWTIDGLVLSLGVLNAFQTPARQLLVGQLVGLERVANAIGLYTVLSTGAQAIGFALMGVVMHVFGAAPCPAVGAVCSGVMALIASKAIGGSALDGRRAASSRRPRHVLGHVRATPVLWVPLASLLIVVGVTTSVEGLVPVLATQTWHGRASTYSMMGFAFALGSAAGAFGLAVRGRAVPATVVAAGVCAGSAAVVAAASPWWGVQLAVIAGLGGGGAACRAAVNAHLQRTADDTRRGAVMGLYAAALGFAPVIGVVMSGTADRWGPRFALSCGGGIVLLTAGAAHLTLVRARRAADGRHVAEVLEP